MGHRKRGFPMFPPDLFPPEEEFESSSSSEESGAESGEEEGEPATLAEALRRALDAAPPPGEFTTGGELSAQQPGLELFDSNGSADVVGLPLSAATEAAIKASCQPAPARGRGRGKKSKVAQAQFTSFRLTNPKWQEAVDKVLAECREALGLADVAVNAQLHKLVLYESGSSYSLPHTEQEATQAADCTWGTLYIQLPSAYQGGRLVVSHGGSSKAFDFAANSAFGTHYAALFADCEHEVEAVTGGRFLALVYNLVCKDSSKRPRPPDRASAMAAVRAVVQRWEDELQADESTTPCKLVYALENVYYDDEETGGLQGNLVGADRSTSHMLAALQAEGLLDVHLGSVEWDEFGYPGKYARSQPRIKKWLSLDNQRVFGWDTMDLFSETELCQGADYLKTLKPYHVEEGRNRWAPRTREYEFTAFVVWPSSRHYAMLCMDSLACAAGGLRRAAQQVPPATQWVPLKIVKVCHYLLCVQVSACCVPASAGKGKHLAWVSHGSKSSWDMCACHYGM